MTQHTHREHVEGCFRCELGKDEVALSAEHDTCTRTHCDLPTVDDDVCWWCRNSDAGTYFAVETDA